MTIECYLGQCPKHGSHEGAEGPLCFWETCHATPAERELYSLTRKLELEGYSVADLERSNPYNQWMHE